MVCAVSIVVGYLMGSILPAYFLGRLYHLDIRRVGMQYAGTVNVYHTLGLLPAIPTAIYDAFKGVLAIFISQRLTSNFVCAQLSGLAAIAGHVLPFYLGFRGGQGVACATGIMLYYLVHYLTGGGLFLYELGFLFVVVAILTYITRQGELIGMIVLPLLCYTLFLHALHDPHNPFLVAVVAYIIAVGLYNTVERGLLKITDETLKRHWWRVAARPGALTFIVIYLRNTQRMALQLIGCVAIFFILLDIVRFVHRRTSMFLSLIFGDIFGKLFGLMFGRHKIRDKTLEGTLAYWGGALICAYVLYNTLHISPLLLGIGATGAAITELLSFNVDDNFTVPLVSGTLMHVIDMFVG
ncbi:hypothetical protein CGW93_01780 [candidate division bacterium WOR-3 4484_18]|uniref:Glycerol-3-phosphate acyltransferase n=1 Tax=candidate division WOR-3 bacterium 4484_18 TaxID=2020626 RepID=A0A257LUY1_UNCW3|nr:MAG: hypothetical protein CGW93_01780 [candidate division bacterium WOR-3 4484_18]